MRDPARLVVALVVATAVVVLDQFTKSKIVAELAGGQPVVLINPWFRLEYAENRGVAFGMLSGNPWILATVALAVLVLVTAHIRQRWSLQWAVVVAAGLTFGGAIANAWDRIRLGYVVDYISIGSWPNFNIADSAISLGVLLLVADVFLHPDPKPEALTNG